MILMTQMLKDGQNTNICEVGLIILHIANVKIIKIKMHVKNL